MPRRCSMGTRADEWRARTRPAEAGWLEDRCGGPVRRRCAFRRKTLYAGRWRRSPIGPDGRVLWKIDLHGRLYSTPCVGDTAPSTWADAAVLRHHAVGASLEARHRGAPNRAAIGQVESSCLLGAHVYAVAFGTLHGGSTPAKVYTAPRGRRRHGLRGSQDHHVYRLGRWTWCVADLGETVDGAPAWGRRRLSWHRCDEIVAWPRRCVCARTGATCGALAVDAMDCAVYGLRLVSEVSRGGRVIGALRAGYGRAELACSAPE